MKLIVVVVLMMMLIILTPIEISLQSDGGQHEDEKSFQTKLGLKLKKKTGGGQYKNQGQEFQQ